MPETVEDFPATYELGITQEMPWIKCLGCGLTSYLLGDVMEHYCGHCHIFHDDLWPPSRQWFIENTRKVGKPTHFIAHWRLGTMEQALEVLKRQGRE